MSRNIIHPNEMSVAEVLRDVMTQKGTHAKIKYLQEHPRYDQLKTFFLFTYHPDWKAKLPKGKTKFTPQNEEMEGYSSDHYLWTELRRLYIFADAPIGLNLDPIIARRHWIGLLENCTDSDAALLDKAKDGKLNKEISGLTENFVKMCYPTLLPVPEGK